MILKNLILILILILPTLISAQKSDNDSRFDVGIFVLPELSGLIKIKNSTNVTNSPQLGLSLGLNLEFQFTKTSSFRTGLGIGFKNLQQLAEGLVFNSDIDPILGVISTSSVKTKYSLTELQLPLIFQYKFNEKFFFTAGCEVNYIVSTKTFRSFLYGNGESEETSSIVLKNEKPLNLSPLLSFGYIKTFENQSDIVVEPLFKIYAIDFEHAATRMYNVGLKLSYNFGV